MTQELSVIERAENALSLATLKPKLIELAKKSERIVAITTADGREECHRALMVLRDQRVTIEKTGKEARDDATKFSKAVISAESELVACIEPEEKRLKALRDAWDGEIERERQAKIEAERKRVEGIQRRIAQLRTPPVTANNTPDEIQSAIDALAATVIDDSFGEFAENGTDARDGALMRLREAHQVAVAREEQKVAEQKALEAEKQRLADARAQLERDQAAAKEQADREAAERREREEADARERRAREDQERAEREAKDAEARAQREAQERAQREQEAREAEQRRQEQEAQAQRLREQEEQLRRDREAVEAQRVEQERVAREKAIAEATVDAATREALDLLRSIAPNHITTLRLAAALERAALPAAA